LEFRKYGCFPILANTQGIFACGILIRRRSKGERRPLAELVPASPIYFAALRLTMNSKLIGWFDAVEKLST
jgi:hypothetical protein